MLGQPHRHFDEADSTNRIALEWLDAPHGAVVTAEAQTAGRGRLGRNWSSPAGRGLYLSVVLRSEQGASVAYLSLIAALSVAQAVASVAKVNAQVKWPNDVLVGGRKICGILCEARDERVIVGIGINVNHREDDLPPRVIFPATSLFLLKGHEMPIEEVQEAVLRQLESNLARDWQCLHADYLARLYGLNELVKVGDVLGLLSDVSVDGALIIRTADGEKPIVAGDVEFL